MTDAPDAEICQAHNRRDGKDDRRDDPRRHANAEQHHDGDQIDEGRNGLHDVEDWPNGAPCQIASGGKDAQRNANDGAEQDRGHDHRKGCHRFGPVADHVDKGEPENREDGRALARPTPSGQCESKGACHHRHPQHEGVQHVQDSGDRHLRGPEERPEIRHQPATHEAVHPVIEGDGDKVSGAKHPSAPSFGDAWASVHRQGRRKGHPARPRR